MESVTIIAPDPTSHGQPVRVSHSVRASHQSQSTRANHVESAVQNQQLVSRNFAVTVSQHSQ
eukprot:11179052-Lingulodinium_polyedra.AAC.1